SKETAAVERWHATSQRLLDLSQLLLRRTLLTQALFLFPQFGCKLVAEVIRLEYAAKLELSVLERAALRPFDGFLHRLHLPYPVASDQFFGLGEGAIHHVALVTVKVDAYPLCAAA